MFATLSEAGTLIFGDGTAPEGAVEVPAAFVELIAEPGRLVWQGQRIEDAASIRTWYVGPDGTRRAFKMGEDWTRVLGDWKSRLVKGEDGKWSLESDDDAKKAALYDYAGRARKRREVGGVDVSGLRVETDERTTAFLTGAYARAKFDKTYAIPRWKVGPGAYIALSNAQIVALGEAVADHIQRCFDLNDEADAAIAAGEVTTEGQIDTIFGAG